MGKLSASCRVGGAQKWLRTHELVLAALVSVCAIPAAARDCPAPESNAIGSAPAILAKLAPQWLAAARLPVRIDPPHGPPQGRLDPALDAFLHGKRDFALLTREIAEADLATFRAAHDGRSPLVLPVAAGNWNRFGYVDAVGVIVHRSNPIRSLSLRQLDAIFSTTRRRGGAEVRTWGDLGLRGNWAARPVKLAGGGGWAAEESARALTIRRIVFGTGGRWKPAPGSGDDSDVVERVGRDPAAIGFTGMGHLSADVRAIPLTIAGKPVAPSETSARAGTYPLLRTVDLLIDPPTASAATLAFARFLLSDASQAITARQGDVMPLPRGVLAQSRHTAARLGCGR